MTLLVRKNVSTIEDNFKSIEIKMTVLAIIIKIY
jgi:hypothetical protein